MSEPTAKQVAAKKVLFAAFIEGLFILAGILAYAMTGNWVLLAIGVIGGLAFTLPAIINFVRVSLEGRDRASR